MSLFGASSICRSETKHAFPTPFFGGLSGMSGYIIFFPFFSSNSMATTSSVSALISLSNVIFIEPVMSSASIVFSFTSFIMAIMCDVPEGLILFIETKFF